jgi:hypothetical protein
MIELESGNKYAMSCFFKCKTENDFFHKFFFLKKRHFKKILDVLLDKQAYCQKNFFQKKENEYFGLKIKETVDKYVGKTYYNVKHNKSQNLVQWIIEPQCNETRKFSSQYSIDVFLFLDS